MERAESRITRRQCLTAMAATAAATLTPGFSRAENGRALLRVAASIETLAGANVNDARVAYRVWIDEAFRQYGKVTGEMVPDFFLPSEELIRDIRQGTVDCYVVTALELAKVVELTDPGSIVLQDYQAEGTEYVVLVHTGSSYRKIADLKGAQVVAHRHRDMLLLPAWLEILLAENNFPEAEHFFASYKQNENLNQVLLPVFFHGVNAGIIARRSWETATELNPQLGRELRALAVSPRVIPAAMGFRRNSNAAARQLLLDSLMHMSKLPAGQQIAALYQSREFVTRPLSAMRGTLELVHQYERVLAQRVAARKGRS